MKFAMKAGIEPTIAGIKSAAQTYQSFTSTQERATWAAKTFGKQWTEVARLLELTPDQIDASTKAAEKFGLVIGKDNVEAAKKLFAAMDDLEDAQEGLTLQAGTKLIPIWTKVIETFNKGTVAGFEIAEELLTISDLILHRLYPNLMLLVEGAGSWVETIDSSQGSMDGYIQRLDEVAEGMGEIATAEDIVKKAAEEAAIAQGKLKDKLSDLQSYIAGPLRSEAQSYLEDQANINGKMTETGAKIDEVKGKIDELEGKSYLTEAQKEQLDGYKTDLGDLQEDYTNLTGEITSNAAAHDLATKKILFNLMTQSAAVDGLTGSEIAALDAVAVKWGLIDQTTLISSQNIDAAFLAMANGAGIQETIGKLTDIGNIVNDIPKNVEINIHTTYTESGAPLPGNPKAPTRPRRALGGPVSAGQEVVVGEQGPEIFIPSQNGRIIPNVTNNYGSNDNSAVVAAIAALRAEFRNMPRMLRDQLAKVG
jgi:hypothetical protein